MRRYAALWGVCLAQLALDAAIVLLMTFVLPPLHVVMAARKASALRAFSNPADKAEAERVWIDAVLCHSALYRLTRWIMWAADYRVTWLSDQAYGLMV